MKIIIIIVFSFFVAFNVFGQSVDSIIEDLIVDMTLNYKQEHSDLVFRPNIAIVPVQDQSPNARKYEVGPAVTAILESKIEKSIIFSLVTDALRDKMIKEIKFSLSGLAESDNLEPGQIEAVDYFLTGQITELGSDFMLSLRLIDVESGKVEDTLDHKIPKDKIYQVSEKYTASYVSPYGIGIEFSFPLWNYLYGDTVAIEGQPYSGEYGYMSISLNYRVSKWLVLWGGLDFSPGGMRFENTFETENTYFASDFKNIDNTSGLSASPADGTFTYDKDRTNFFSIIFGGGYVFNITKTFNITLGAVLSMSQTFLNQTYFLPTVDNDDVEKYVITSNDISLWSVTPRLKLQYFVKPRVALHHDYGFKYQFAENKAYSYYFRDGTYDKNNTISELYGLNPAVDPQGREHHTDLTGHTASMGVGFYF